MFKKIKPLWLVFILAILVGVYFIVRYTSQNDRNFMDIVLKFEPKSITEIIVTLPTDEEQTRIVRDGEGWIVYVKGKPYKADTSAVMGMLGHLSRLETKRFAGKGHEMWKRYELTDSTGTRVILKEGNKQVADIMVGKFDYTTNPDAKMTGGMTQPPADMSTYVRLTGENEVYVVDGYLRMTVGRGSEAYRDKGLVGELRNNISRVTFEQPEEKMILERQDKKWTLDGMPADSAKSARYVTMIARMGGQEFIYEDLPPGEPTHTVTIEGDNFTPVEIWAYPVADTNYNYIIRSSKNPGSLFSGKKSDLFNRIFEDRMAFLPDLEGE